MSANQGEKKKTRDWKERYLATGEYVVKCKDTDQCIHREKKEDCNVVFYKK